MEDKQCKTKRKKVWYDIKHAVGSTQTNNVVNWVHLGRFFSCATSTGVFTVAEVTWLQKGRWGSGDSVKWQIYNVRLWIKFALSFHFNDKIESELCLTWQPRCILSWISMIFLKLGSIHSSCCNSFYLLDQGKIFAKITVKTKA